MSVYLDYAATTPIRKEVIEYMNKYIHEVFGNPSSLHSFGKQAKRAIEDARDLVADLINANTNEIIFTSSGTEGNNQALFGMINSNSSKNHIITSKIEHPSVIQSCKELEKRGCRITYLNVDKDGLVDLQELEKAICENTILVTIMHANNEIGTIQPIEMISKVIRKKEKDLKRKIYFHTDAVQTAGILQVDVEHLDVDLLTISSHKIYGPKGAGALFVKKGTPIRPIIFGGGQESNKRASTENVMSIAGFGKAAKLIKDEREQNYEHTKLLRDKLLSGILEKIPEVIHNGHIDARLPSNLNISIKHIEGESLLLYLDMENIAASTGSACSSSTLQASHVLLAIGLEPVDAHGSLRFSFGKYNTLAQIDYVLEKLPIIVGKLRKMSPLYKEKI
jgi:cysteine desulfurase